MRPLLLAGAIYFVLGLILKMIPPKKINAFYGYRTFRSMKNMETWNVANRYSAFLLSIFGIALLFIGLITLLLFHNHKAGIVIDFLSILISIIMLLILTEAHLNKLFDKEGKRKLLS